MLLLLALLFLSSSKPFLFLFLSFKLLSEPTEALPSLLLAYGLDGNFTISLETVFSAVVSAI